MITQNEQYKKSENKKLNNSKINLQITSYKLNSKIKLIYTNNNSCSISENNKIKINTIIIKYGKK